MHRCLEARPETADNKMRVRIAAEQKHLEKEHTGCPHLRASAEPRKNVLAEQRLDLK